VRAGFTGVGADECVRGNVITVEKLRDRTAKREKSGVVEGRSSG
jgi:hypothetical protein